jgi:hypothetical protein
MTTMQMLVVIAVYSLRQHNSRRPTGAVAVPTSTPSGPSSSARSTRRRVSGSSQTEDIEAVTPVVNDGEGEDESQPLQAHK